LFFHPGVGGGSKLASKEETKKKNACWRLKKDQNTTTRKEGQTGIAPLNTMDTLPDTEVPWTQNKEFPALQKSISQLKKKKKFICRNRGAA